jgi:hypothetical protein
MDLARISFLGVTTSATAVVEQVIEQITGRYIFPERALAGASLLRSRLGQGAYQLPVSPEFCQRVSADLFEACSDRHLRLVWHESPEAGSSEAELVAELRGRFRRENHGVRRVELLSGNVGLIEITIIPPVADAGETIAAAFHLVKDTDALILDLREGLGGAPDGTAFLCSFLFPDGEVHLNDIIEGSGGAVRQYWSLPYLPGPRYVNRSTYVLTSSRTFSGGEEVAYDLQALGRATLIGETTGGGAHPSETVPLGDHIELRLPVARPVNPVTGTNWEGVGVVPDVSVPASTALVVAHRTALENLAEDEALTEATRVHVQEVLNQLEDGTRRAEHVATDQV